MAQEIDSFSAQILLQTAVNNPDKVDEVADLYKMLKSNNDGGPSREAVLFFEKYRDCIVKVKRTGYHGVVYMLNTATGGFYPGSRYPIHVQITSADDPKFQDAVGQVFEYDIDDLEPIEVKNA